MCIRDRVRQAQARRASALETVTLTERGVIAQVRSAYASYQSALRVIESSRVAVDANKLSLEGVRAENSVGTRTIRQPTGYKPGASGRLTDGSLSINDQNRPARIRGHTRGRRSCRATADHDHIELIQNETP